jgi:subtilisin family serine protease
MKRIAVFSIFFVLLQGFVLGQTNYYPQKCSPELQEQFKNGGKSDMLVVFTEQANITSAKALPTKLAKAEYVYNQLELTLARTQTRVSQILHAGGFSSNSLRIVNAIAVNQADGNLARQLADLPEVAWMGTDPWIQFEPALQAQSAAPAIQDRSQVEWGVAKISAPEVWALGYNGQGITVGGADTGYDWLHPAIQPHYRGWDAGSNTSNHNYNWHDAIIDYSPLNYDTSGNPGTNPCGIHISAPCDDNNHGTHTMGTMTGDDGQGNMIGVAPGAKWIGCRNMERGWGRPSSYLGCFEWFLAPTDLNGQNPDPSKAPHVINNSWYCAYMEGCTDSLINDLLRIAIVNLKASGVVVVISNGNSGPWCGTTSEAPAYFEESFSVGATRIDDAIANFSSRGPVLVDGSNRMKPNVSAPGQDVRSSIPNNNYANFSGTSMAGPHVVGLVALMLSARPELAGHVEDIEQMIQQTAIYFGDTINCGPSIGTAQPNHSFGWGRVDALGAVNQALLWQAPVSTQTPVLSTVNVYPNPVQETAVFDLQNFSGKTLVEIVNMEGKTMFSQTITPGVRQLYKVNINSFSSGIYVYKISCGATVLSGKLIKS